MVSCRRAAQFTVAAVCFCPILPADDGQEDGESVAQRRLTLMQERVAGILVESGHSDIPDRLEPKPLFRYDDPTRGYVDGTIWRLGKRGRPYALVTAELHPSFFGRPSIVYDLLSFTDRDFNAASTDVDWRPRESGMHEGDLGDGPQPAATDVLRLVQMKRIMQRFDATQEVEGERIQLRRLPQPIDRYRPTNGDDRRDGAMFLFVNGRNPGIVLLLETDGDSWRYLAGRLSTPSTLTVSLDGSLVWRREPLPPITDWNAAYTGANARANIPGVPSASPPF